MISASGLAAPVNRVGKTLRGREFFAPGAFAPTIASGRCEAWVNHKPGYVIACQHDGTLELQESERGLMFSLHVRDDDVGNMLVGAAVNRQIRACNVGWDEDKECRRFWPGPEADFMIESVTLTDLTLCLHTWPVFDDTFTRVFRPA